jgi:N-acetylneuraminic acid mutarotase
MPGINSFKRGRIKKALKSVILVISFLALLSACGGGGGTSPNPPNPPPVSTGKWTWVSGSNTVNQAGIYGTKGTADPSNVPGARSGSATWTDSSGKLWLFGGVGLDLDGQYYHLNDLWKFDPTTLEWTWVSGSNTIFQPDINYGTKGVPDPFNLPGPREEAVSWLDSSGNFWLFGGNGLDSAYEWGWLNDLWKFDPTTLEWTWISGSDFGWQWGNYGTRGIPDPSNVPGGRKGAVSWIDSSGNLWLFGGEGNDSTGVSGGDLNDLWKYNPTTHEWTWVSGSNVSRQNGTYGTKGTADPSNVPGARYSPVSWTDSSGKLWLFGGEGLNSAGNGAWLNDLWKFDPTTLEWTWVSGSDTTWLEGIYGIKGIAAPSNVPRGRDFAVSWIDSSGKLWLFGGQGFTQPWLNDLWKFDPATLEWTWVSGSNTGNQESVYGTKGTAASSNVPGGRWWAVSWKDSGDKLWLFGGEAYFSANPGLLNDLWRYTW